MGASSRKERLMTKKPVSKIIAFITAVCTLVVMCGLPAVAFAWEGGITKEETVYVVTDSSGTQGDVIVSDHLVNKNKAETISDETTLSDIENVKGEETFKQKGDALTWDAEGNSIYYQGKTDAEVPVTMDIVYRLNDKVVSGSELQGQSGNVEIRINYENNAEYQGTTVPFVVMTGLIVTDDSFKNIKISKGKVIDDGEKLLVVGMAAPGLAQTLGVGESELGFGSSVTITGDADKFAVEDMMTIVTNAFFEDIDTGSLGDLDYDDEIDQLNKGSKALVEGSDKLYKGLNDMDDQMPDFVTGTTELDKGAKNLSMTLSAQMQELIGGTEQLKTGAQNVLTGLQDTKTSLDNQVIPGLESISDGLSDAAGSLNNNKVPQAASDVASYMAIMNKAKNSLNSTNKPLIKSALVSGGLTEEEADLLLNEDKIKGVTKEASGVSVALNGNVPEGANLPDQLSAAAAGISKITGEKATETDPSTGLHLMSDSLGSTDNEKTLIGGTAAIYKGLDDINSKLAANTAKDGKLKIGLDALTSGTSSLKGGSERLANGVDMLSAGSLKLSQGMSKLYNEGIKKIVDLYKNDLKGTLDNANSMLDAGKGYKTFTKLPAGMDGNVKFIYKTDMTE